MTSFPKAITAVCLLLLALGIPRISGAESPAPDCAEAYWTIGTTEATSPDILIYLPNKSADPSKLKTAPLIRDGYHASRDEAGHDFELNFQKSSEDKKPSRFSALIGKFVNTPNGLSLLGGYHPSFYLGPSRAKFTVRDVSLEASSGRTEVTAVIDTLDVQNSSSRMDLIKKGVGGVGLPSVTARSTSPITVRIPLNVEVGPDGKMGFKLLNLPDPDMSKVVVEMSGGLIPTEKAMALLKDNGVIDKVRTQLLNFLNSQIADPLARDIKQSVGISHPLTRAELLKLQVSPQNVTADSSGLKVGIGVDIGAGKKPATAKPIHFNCPVAGSGRCPEYDAAVAVSQPLIQDLVKQLFDSGAMKGIKAGNRTLTIVETPTIHYLTPPTWDHGQPSAYVKVGLRVRPDDLSGMEGMALRNHFSVGVDVSLKVSPSDDGKGIAVKVINTKTGMSAIDESGFQAPFQVLGLLRSFAPPVIRKTVDGMVNDVINSQLRRMTSMPPMQLPLPPEARKLLGSAKITGIQFDDQNNLYFLFK